MFKAVKVVMSLLTSQVGLGMKARAVSEQERAAIAAEGSMWEECTGAMY